MEKVTRTIECEVFIGCSMDGFIARLDGSLDWLDDHPKISGEDYGYQQFMNHIDVIVMGRITFEKVLTFAEWPYQLPVVVLSRQSNIIPDQLHNRVQLLNGEPAAILQSLLKRGFQRVYLDGGLTIQRFLRQKLVRRMILSRLPVLLGQGIPLFGPLDHDQTWHHVQTRVFDNGVIQSEYLSQKMTV